MTKKTRIAAAVAAVCAVALIAAPGQGFAQAQSARVTAAVEAQQRADFARLLDSTKGLNAALKRISQERKLDYAAVIGKGEQQIGEAERAAAAGRLVEARMLLDDAYLGCKLAIAEIAKGSASQPAATTTAPADGALQKAYADRKDSTVALRDALARVAQEKGDDKGRAEVPVIDKLIADADRHVAAGEVRQGRAIVDHAYLRAKVQIERLRSGDTLVRTLHFDNKGDEYRYEQDRNETYRMLIPMLVPNGSEREAQLKGVLERARVLRGEADQKAKGQALDDALKLIDQSTAEYQKAIRNAGVLLPG